MRQFSDFPPYLLTFFSSDEGLVKRADESAHTSDYATMAMDTVDYLFPPSEWSLKNDSRFLFHLLFFKCIAR